LSSGDTKIAASGRLRAVTEVLPGLCGLSADAANTYRGRVSGILVVDDDRTVGEVLLKYLQRSELDGRHVETAADLLTELDTMQPDLLVLDVMLPDGDGMS